MHSSVLLCRPCYHLRTGSNGVSNGAIGSTKEDSSSPMGLYKHPPEIRLAEKCLQQFIASPCGNESPSYFVDCRSGIEDVSVAPTYLLASQVGFKRATPFAIGAAAGLEVAFALRFLLDLFAEDGASATAVVSAIQGCLNIDTKDQTVGSSISCAATAFAVCQSTVDDCWAFEVRSVCFAGPDDLSSESESPAARALAGSLLDAGLHASEIRWSLSSNCSSWSSRNGGGLLPSARSLVRRRMATAHFGCVDVPVSLAMLAEDHPEELYGFGTLWFAGTDGSVAVAVGLGRSLPSSSSIA